MRFKTGAASLAALLCLQASFIASQAPKSGDAPSTQAEIHAKISSLYNFHPSKLTDDGRQKKSDEMDAFWSSVKANQTQMLPMLRVELVDESNPSFFMTDGSQLLLSLSQTKADKQLALDAVTRSDLEDVDSGMYFYLVHGLSMEGFDTTKASLHIFDFPKFAVSVPQHAMILYPRDCIMFMLLPVETEKWLPAVRERFANTTSEDEKKALLGLIFYAQTPETDAVIASAATSTSGAVKDDALGYLKDEQEALKHTLPQSESEVKLSGTVAEIRERRRVRLGAVSDEAMDDVQLLTMRIVQLRHGMK